MHVTAPGAEVTSSARLSFEVRPEGKSEFAEAFGDRLAPLLKPHDLVPSAEREPSGPAGVWSQLFEVANPAVVEEKRRALRRDSQWHACLCSLGKEFGTGREGTALKYHWGIYRSPAGPGRSAMAGPGSRKGAWQGFGVRDGLPSSVVTTALQDREGILWFGTWGSGVCRYDGSSFTAYGADDGLPGDVVHVLAQDDGGLLWLGTEEGACRFDGRTFRSFTIADGLPPGQVWAMAPASEGGVWVGTPAGLARSHGEAFRAFDAGDGAAGIPVSTIARDRSGGLWVAACGGGVSRHDGERLANVPGDDGLGRHEVRAMAADRDGNLWLATEAGVSRYDGQAVTRLAEPEGAADNDALALLVDSAGQVWVGTHLGGVSRYCDGRFDRHTTADGLTSDTVVGLAEDRAGQLWCATWGGGICRYEGRHLAVFGTRQGLASEGVTRVAEDRAGRLWCATWAGVSRRDGEAFSNVTAARSLAGHEVRALVEDRQGRMWFGTSGIDGMGGASHCLGEAFVSFATVSGAAGDGVMAIQEDRRGHLWFGTNRSGVSRYDGERFDTFTTADGLASDEVLAILEDREGHLWFGTRGGASRYDGERFITFTTAHGLSHDVITSILEDAKGHLWFGTWGGVSRYDGERFVRYGTAHGLAHKVVTSIYQDRAGHLWFGTLGGGVNRYDGRVFQLLHRQDGLAHDAVHDILQDRRGDYWFATEGGVTRYRPSPLLPAIRITEVITSQRHGPVAEVEVSVSHPLLGFEFQGSSWTTRPQGMAYLYRLQGYQEEWRVTHSPRVEYQDLALGEYLFEVKAVDRDLNYSAEPARVRVTVVPDPLVEGLAVALSQSGRSEELVGTSPALREVQRQLGEAVDTDLPLLLLGETGTGKGLAARIVHAASRRNKGPFIAISCGALPERLVESELFGHEKGAFTGAHSRKLGRVELAEGGTLFLDEIGDLPLEAQGKLLRLVDEYSFERVGATRSLCADVRIIAATNRDLRLMVSQGTFRRDLYYRLRVLEVELPPLRQRRQDIPLLAVYFLERMAAHIAKKVGHFMPEALDLLCDYDWPGNVRELQHVVERAVVVCTGPAVRRRDVMLDVGRAIEPAAPFPARLSTLEEMERQHICQVLEHTHWVVAGPRGATAILGIPESTLRHRIKKLGIKRPAGAAGRVAPPPVTPAPAGPQVQGSSTT